MICHLHRDPTSKIAIIGSEVRTEWEFICPAGIDRLNYESVRRSWAPHLKIHIWSLGGLLVLFPGTDWYSIWSPSSLNRGMALQSSSSSIHPTSDNSKSFNAPKSDGYQTPSVELTAFAPFGNILNATDNSTKHLVPPRGNSQDDTVLSSDHPPVSPDTAVVDSFPDGGTRSWIVVLGSFFLLMASYGMMNSVGVFQSYLETNQLSSYSSTDVGWISSSFVFVALLLGVYIGPLFDTHGPKVLVYGGSVIFMLSLILFAECKQYWQFLLTFGVLGGIGAALVSTVAMACVPHWFEIRAGQAIGTALAGSGLGGIVFPFVMRAGFSNIGFKWTMRVLAFVVGCLCLLGSFMVRARLPRRKSSKAVIDLRCFKDLKFTFMTLSTFCKSHPVSGFRLSDTWEQISWSVRLATNWLFNSFGAAILLITRNVSDIHYRSRLLDKYECLPGCRPKRVGLLIYFWSPTYITEYQELTYIKSFGTIGRLVAGRIADRYGRLNTLAVAVVLTTLWLFILLYPFQKSVPVLYIFSCLYGLTAASFISVSPVCIRQISDTKEIGLRFGTCYSVVSFAWVIPPLLCSTLLLASIWLNAFFKNSLLVSIPITGELMQKGGPKAMIIWSGSLLVWASCLLALTRWTCLEYTWKWKVKI